jgi:hypothetical protein
MKRHRTKIIEKRIHSNHWIFSFVCNSCSFPQDYQREWHHNLDGRLLAVDDARAHRFAYRAIEARLFDEAAVAAGAHPECSGCDECYAIYERLEEGK